MESSMYWLDLIAETYIGICVLCCLFIISKQRRRPAPMMRVMLLVWLRKSCIKSYFFYTFELTKRRNL